MYTNLYPFNFTLITLITRQTSWQRWASCYVGFFLLCYIHNLLYSTSCRFDYSPTMSHQLWQWSTSLSCNDWCDDLTLFCLLRVLPLLGLCYVTYTLVHQQSYSLLLFACYASNSYSSSHFFQVLSRSHLCHYSNQHSPQTIVPCDNLGNEWPIFFYFFNFRFTIVFVINQIDIVLSGDFSHREWLRRKEKNALTFVMKF